MRRKRPFSLVALLGAMMAHAQTAPTTQDAVVLNTGERRVGRITAVDAQSFTFEMTVVAGQPLAVIKVPRASVSQVDFGPDEARDAFLTQATPAQVAKVAPYWAKWEPFLAIPKSPSARIGIRYGALLIDSNDKANLATARDLFARLEREAWSEEDRMMAKQGRLRVMIAVGQGKEAVAEATELVKSATDPAVIIEAKYILARAADESLRKLVEENPRWQEDDRVRPERNRLYHEAVDDYLDPYLAYAARGEAVARGLWRLVDLYRFVGESQLALETARDVVALYAGTPYAKSAADWIARLPAEAKAEDFEAEARRAAGLSPSTKPNEKK